MGEKNCGKGLLRIFERTNENVPHFTIVHLAYRTRSSGGIYLEKNIVLNIAL